MRILLLSWNFPPVRGGIEYVVENLFAGLRRRGHQIAVVTTSAEGDEKDPDVHRAPAAALKRYVRYSITKGFALCRSMRPDAILCGTLVGAPAGYVLSRLFGKPYIVLVHGSDILRPGCIYHRVARFLLRRATRIVANSTQTGRLLPNLGVNERKVEVIHPGVRVGDFVSGVGAASAAVGTRPRTTAAEAAPTAASPRRVLLSVGRLIRRKGLLEFVEHAMPALVRRYPNVLLLIVGEDAKASLVHPERMREKIEAKVRELRLEEHVKLLGGVPQAELVELFRRAELFVLPVLDVPADVEGFGIVAIEAAMAGVPTVGTRVGGVPEAVDDGKTGLLVEPGDHDAMIGAIARLLDDETLRRSLGQAAESRARTQFAWDVIIEQYERMMASAIAASADRPRR